MITELLREALSDAAATVEHVRPLTGRVRRRRRWVVPAAVTATAVTAAMAVTVVATRPGDVTRTNEGALPSEVPLAIRESRPPAHAPTASRWTLAAYTDAKYVLVGAGMGGAPVAVNDAATGKQIALVPVPPGSTGYWDTAGAGDNRTFFLTSVDYKRAIVSFYRLRLNADGHPQQLSELPRATLHNGLQGEGPQLLAATNGGTKLAYVTETGAELTVTHGGSSMTDDAEIRERIHIIDPRTGDQQAISLPQGTVIDELVWAPDGRALAFTEETPGNGLRTLDPVTGAIRHVDLGGDDGAFRAADIGSDGDIVALTYRADGNHLVWYSLATSKITRDVPLEHSHTDQAVGPTIVGDAVVVVIGNTMYRVTGTSVRTRHVGHDIDLEGTW